jgi:formylglycine-generating enzyme required for sulfatase activity
VLGLIGLTGAAFVAAYLTTKAISNSSQPSESARVSGANANALNGPAQPREGETPGTDPSAARVLPAQTSAAADRAPEIARPHLVERPSSPAPSGMVWVPGGEFVMGTDSEMAWPDERPAHRVRVDGFWMDEHEVTNGGFGAFVASTGYVTTAEKAPTAEEILRQSPPGTPPPRKELLVPGALVFTPPSSPVPLDDYSQWWKWTPGANWRHPDGPGSSIEGKDKYPVVQVSWDDAVSYAKWAGKRLPTEAEWERAARGALDRKLYVWGDQAPSQTAKLANIWQGQFPNRNSAGDGFARLAPVKSFAPNGYGLYDVAGNVWEWCSDWYQADLYRSRAGQGVAVNPQGPERSSDPANPYEPRRVQRGGSFLCSDDYCTRYRPSARQGGAPDTGMSHVGFRCVRSAGPG